MIEILSRQTKFRVSRKRFKALLEFLADRFGLQDPEVSLAFVGTKAITTLNKKFMKKNGPTDVLSFPVGKKGSDGRYYLGDIIISVPQAFKQSLSQSHGLERELELLTIHGFLHLVGLDHDRGIEEEERRISRILDKD